MNGRPCCVLFEVPRGGLYSKTLFGYWSRLRYASGDVAEPRIELLLTAYHDVSEKEQLVDLAPKVSAYLI